MGTAVIVLNYLSLILMSVKTVKTATMQLLQVHPSKLHFSRNCKALFG